MTKLEQIIEGLKIFHKYDKNCSTQGAQDVFMVLCDPEDMTEQDKNLVKYWGWDTDEYGGWSIFT
jgi:hypothetical protein